VWWIEPLTFLGVTNMSATKWRSKWVRTASDDDLIRARLDLERQVREEPNAMIRSSLKTQLETIQREQGKREVPV
jgi:hypothetical protein